MGQSGVSGHMVSLESLEFCIIESSTCWHGAEHRPEVAVQTNLSSDTKGQGLQEN